MKIEGISANDANERIAGIVSASDGPPAAVRGKELASLIRTHHANGSVPGQDALAALAKLMIAPASTPADALALAVQAQKLMPLAMQILGELDEDPDRTMAVGLVAELIDRIVWALEAASGVKADTFTGFAPALN